MGRVVRTYRRVGVSAYRRRRHLVGKAFPYQLAPIRRHSPAAAQTFLRFLGEQFVKFSFVRMIV